MNEYHGISQVQRPYDKIEPSPTSRATCKLCKNNIQKGDWRIGIHRLYKGYIWTANYYHKTCCVSTTRGSSILKGAYFKSQPSSSKRKNDSISMEERIEIESSDDQRRKRVRQTLLDSRSDLRELLRLARTQLARHLNRPPYCIFHNTVLDSLVERMPSNDVELLAVPGFGPVKCASLGKVFLAIVNAYRRRIDGKGQIDRSAKTIACATTHTQPVVPRTAIDVRNNRSDDGDDDSDDDEVIVAHEISIDELINNRIREAEERGEVIEL